MGDEKKKATPKKEFFKNPGWWIAFILLNALMFGLKFVWLPATTFTFVFDILIILALVLILIEISHDRNIGDKFFDMVILIILIWILISIFGLPERWNFLIP